MKPTELIATFDRRKERRRSTDSGAARSKSLARQREIDNERPFRDERASNYERSIVEGFLETSSLTRPVVIDKRETFAAAAIRASCRKPER